MVDGGSDNSGPISGFGEVDGGDSHHPQRGSTLMLFGY
jgi:hypothetical protein